MEKKSLHDLSEINKQWYCPPDGQALHLLYFGFAQQPKKRSNYGPPFRIQRLVKNVISYTVKESPAYAEEELKKKNNIYLVFIFLGKYIYIHLSHGIHR